MTDSTNKGLYYVLKPNEVYFYYNDLLLFKNSKSMPFIVVKIKKDGFVKEVALTEVNIYKEKNDIFKLDFFYDEYKVVCYLNQDNYKVSFDINNINNYDEICFTLFKENVQKVYGLCTYKRKEEKLSFFRRLINKIKRRKLIYTEPDKKLAFYVLETYFFENKNIYDYDFTITDKIYVRVRQPRIVFNMIFSKNINVAINQENKNIEKIEKFFYPQFYVKTSGFDVKRIQTFEKHNDLQLDGVIINPCAYNLGRTRINANKALKLNKRIIYAFDGVAYDKNTYPYYKENEVTEVDGVLKINFENESACRKFANNIRKVLDLNVDGIYIDGDFDKKEIIIIHTIIREKIVKEYPKIIILHSTISENNDDFGYYILKNYQLSENFDEYKSYYLYSGENRIGREINEKEYNKTKINSIVNIINIEE